MKKNIIAFLCVSMIYATSNANGESLSICANLTRLKCKCQVLLQAMQANETPQTDQLEITQAIDQLTTIITVLQETCDDDIMTIMPAALQAMIRIHAILAKFANITTTSTPTKLSPKNLSQCNG